MNFNPALNTRSMVQTICYSLHYVERFGRSPLTLWPSRGLTRLHKLSSARDQPSRPGGIKHGARHPRGADALHKGRLVDASEVSVSTAMLRQSQFWLHGHVHQNLHFDVAGCRVIANPTAFSVDERTASNADHLQSAIPRFEQALVIDPTLEAAAKGRLPMATANGSTIFK